MKSYLEFSICLGCTVDIGDPRDGCLAPFAGRGGDINGEDSDYPYVSSGRAEATGSLTGSLSLHLGLEALRKDFSSFNLLQLPITGLY